MTPAKVRALAYLGLGFAISWLFTIDGAGELFIQTLPLTALVLMALHEAAHLISIKALGVKFKPVADAARVGFVVEAKSRKQFIVIAAAPQTITLALLIAWALGLSAGLPLALLHVAMSLEDMAKVLRHSAMPQEGRRKPK